MASALDRWGARFVDKLMDPIESSRLPAAEPERSRAVALAIAGKEAGSKAIGTGWSRGVRWRDVEVLLGDAPRIVFHHAAAARARVLGSSGAAWVHLEIRGRVALGEVRLLS